VEESRALNDHDDYVYPEEEHEEEGAVQQVTFNNRSPTRWINEDDSDDDDRGGNKANAEPDYESIMVSITSAHDVYMWRDPKEDPFALPCLKERARADMKHWTAKRIELLGKTRALAILNAQLAQLGKLVDFGEAVYGKGEEEWRVPRFPLPIKCPPNSSVVVLFDHPYTEEQSTWATAEISRKGKNVNTVYDLIDATKDAMRSSLEGVIFGTLFAIPILKFTSGNRDACDFNHSGLRLFGRYALVALSIIRPRIVVCPGITAARCMFVGMARDGESAGVHREGLLGETVTRIVKDSTDRAVLHTINFVETAHPYIMTDDYVKGWVDHIHKGIKLKEQEDARNSFIKAGERIAAKLEGSNVHIRAYDELMSRRKLFDTDPMTMTGKKNGKRKKGVFDSCAKSAATTGDSESSFSYVSPSDAATADDEKLLPYTLPTRLTKLIGDKGGVTKTFDIYIGRTVRREGRLIIEGTEWGNPFIVSKSCPPAMAVGLFESHIMQRPDLLAKIPELDGKVLACWCKNVNEPIPCHGDVLIRLVREWKRDKAAFEARIQSLLLPAPGDGTRE
jgi:hypothetical protein